MWIPNHPQEAYPLKGSVNQPIEQTGVERSVRDPRGGPQVQVRPRRQAERAYSTVGDEE
jgi:hypothetical protein